MVTSIHSAAQEPVGLGNRRLQIDRSGPFFTVFLPNSSAIGLQIRQKLDSLGPIFAFGAPSPTGSQCGRGRRPLAYPIQKLVKAHYVLRNIEVEQAVLAELTESFRFNDAVLRHLIMKRDEADTEMSIIMKSKDEKGDKPERGERRRRDDEEGEAVEAADTDSDSAEAA